MCLDGVEIVLKFKIGKNDKNLTTYSKEEISKAITKFYERKEAGGITPLTFFDEGQIADDILDRDEVSKNSNRYVIGHVDKMRMVDDIFEVTCTMDRAGTTEMGIVSSELVSVPVKNEGTICSYERIKTISDFDFMTVSLVGNLRTAPTYDVNNWSIKLR